MMTDTQLLVSIRQRAARRLSNILFLNMIDELIIQSRRTPILEKDVVVHLMMVSQVYGITFTDDDLQCVLRDRPPKLSDTTRLESLWKSGFMLGRSPKPKK